MAEGKIARSFRNVKRDITSLREQLSRISEQQGELMNLVLSIKKEKKEKAKVTIVRSKVKKQRYVASKDGKKFHIPECPFAQNIHPHSKRIFKSKKSALNAGYKPDSCVK